MKRKIAIAVVVASLLVLAVVVTVMAQGAGPAYGNQAGDGTCAYGEFVDADGDGVCDNAGTYAGGMGGGMYGANADGTGAGPNGMQQGMMGARRGMGSASRGMNAGNGTQAGQGTMGQGYNDADGDGVCDNFVDEDGDGQCDNCINGSGAQSGMGRQGMQGRGRWNSQ